MPAQETSAAARRARIQRAALVASACLLGVASALGWRFQGPWTDPAHPPEGLWAFFAPIETNAWMRLSPRGTGYPVSPDYSPRDPPQRSPIEDLAVTGAHVFVAFNDGTIAQGPARGVGPWTQARLDVPPRTSGPASLAFLGDLEGYAVAGTGAVFRTSDRGRSWEKVSTRDPLPPLLAIDAFAASGGPVLWALAENAALWSRDGGRTWTLAPLDAAGEDEARREQAKALPRVPSPIVRSWIAGAAQGQVAPPPDKRPYAPPPPPKPAPTTPAASTPTLASPARQQPPPPPPPQAKQAPPTLAPPPAGTQAGAANEPNLSLADEPVQAAVRSDRAPVPSGPYQVCATPRETWLITPRGAFTALSEASREVIRRAPVGNGLVRCVRRGARVMALIEADGGAWRRGPVQEAWGRFDGRRTADLAIYSSDGAIHVGSQGAVWLRGTDGLEMQLPLPWKRDLRRIVVSDDSLEWWVLDADDSLWRTSFTRSDPSGVLWRREIAFRSAITAAAEPERDVLLAATSTGLLLRSSDRGGTWTVEDAFDRPVAALVKTARGAWAAIAAGTRDGYGDGYGSPSGGGGALQGWVQPAVPGERWVPGPISDELLVSPHLDGSLTFPAINDFAATLASSNLLAARVPLSILDGQGITALYISQRGDAEGVWGVGRRGRIVRAVSGFSFHDQPPPPERAGTLRDIALAGGQGWAVGDYGAVFRSDDGGRKWTRERWQSRAALTSVLLSDNGSRVAVFGDGDTVRVSDDGGRSWRSPVNRLYPAPWCFAACALALVLGAAGARRKIPVEVVGAHIEDLLASDAPITDERQDVLGQGEVARTITYFLQNDRTEAPLTVAVSGEWGTGKSSVLNLIRKGLQRAGMPVINFNAWHHQQDQDLLASLFGCIVDGAVPTGPARIEFRLRLLATRWRQRAWAVALIALVAIFLAGMNARAPEYSGAALHQLETAWTCWTEDKGCPEPAKAAAEAKGKEAPAVSSEQSRTTGQARTFWSGLVVSLVVAGLPFLRLIRSLRSFGVNPSALLGAVSGGIRTSGDKHQLAFRARFASEFAEVTTALGRRRLVLLIDDLDRCSSDNLLKMLEALNFLVSSGKCFVVLAMSRSVVLETLAAELPRPAAGAAPTEVADRYLQKLINVEVALPQISAGTGLSLMTRAEGPVPGTEERTLASRAARVGLAVALALGVGWGAYSLGGRTGALFEKDANVSQEGVDGVGEPPALLAGSASPAPPPPGAAASSAGTGTGSRRPGDSQSRAGAPPAGPVQAVPVRIPQGWAVSTPEPPSRSLLGLLPWLFLVAAGLAALAVSSSPRPMTTDSADFREALERWSEVIQLRHPTPRALKRFLNRLRFWAMRLRAEKEPLPPVSPWQRLFSSGPGGRGHTDVISEPALVALAALHEARPELVLRADRFAQVVSTCREQAASAQGEERLLAGAMAAELERSGRPAEADRRRFLELLGTVQTGSA